MTAGAGKASLAEVLKAIGWAILFMAAGWALTIGFIVAASWVLGGLSTELTAQAIMLQSAAGLLGFGLVTFLLGRVAIGLTWADLRYQPAHAGVRGFARGLGLGAVPAALAILTSLIVGGAAFGRDTGGFGAYLAQLGFTILLLAPAAFFEELVFRGVAQVVLARALGRLPAILLLSGVFAAAHLKNPNTTALGILNIGLAGVLLGLAFYAPGGIWTAWGLHLGWNATLAALDTPVSGWPLPMPLINYSPGGPPWLTGGTFGPEGGLLATLAILGATAFAWRWSRKESA